MQLDRRVWRAVRIIDPFASAFVFAGAAIATVGYIYGGIWVLAAIW